MDFVTVLPVSESSDAIYHLTKMWHLIPCKETSGAPELARLYMDNMWKLHGLPDAVVSDRGPQFTTPFWTQLCQLLKIQPRLSTAFHPPTDRQTERANTVMEQYLRSYVSYQQED